MAGQVDRARQRVEQIRREGKFVDHENQPRQESAKEPARRALDDEDLRKGDVVSTESGFLRFEGILPDNRRVFSPVDPGLAHGNEGARGARPSRPFGSLLACVAASRRRERVASERHPGGGTAAGVSP